MEIKEVNLEEIWKIRHEVMYPNKNLEYVKLEDDKNGLHLGLYVENKLVSVISLFVDYNILQFRKFATLSNEQNKGYGSKLLKKVIEYAENKKVKKIWCNSRIEKSNFYEKFGLIKTEKRYEKDGREYIIMELIFR